jgi:hypothetical protein
VNLEIGRVGAAENLRPLFALRPAGAVLFHIGQRACVLEGLANVWKPCQVLQRRLSRIHELDLAARGPLERFARADPDVVHCLRGIVRALLACRRKRDEKTCVEAPRAAGRGDPVPEVGEITGRDVEVFFLEQVAERLFAPLHEALGALR